MAAGFGAQLFDFAAASARHSAARVLTSTAPADVWWPEPSTAIDPTERAVLSVLDAVGVITREVLTAPSRGRLSQLRERIAVCQEALEAAEQEAIDREGVML